MSDEIKIYHIDDPNDAPERRLSAFPLINPFVPTSLPQYVIPPVAESLYTAMKYYWYSAGIAAQRQQQQRYHNYNNNSNSNHLHLHPHQHPHHHHHHHQHHHGHPHQHLHQQQQEPLQTPLVQPQPPQLPQQATQQQLQPQQIATTQQQQQDQQHHNHLNHHHLQQQQQQQQLQKQERQELQQQQNHQQQHHIKKPLNPFMIYMQRMRPKIVEAGRTRESAEINKELGQLWRQLSKEEQEPYYKLAEEEKKLHATKYPGWSARDNYQKKKKKMKLKSISINDQSDKKCRARFGLSNFSEWCKPCKRKKKCQYAIGPNTTN